jgi:hypothetical protein
MVGVLVEVVAVGIERDLRALAIGRELWDEVADWAAWEREMAELDSAAIAYWEGETA